MENTEWELGEAYAGIYTQTDQGEERTAETEDQLNEIKQDKIREKQWQETKPPRNMGLCEKTKPMIDWCTWKWQG